MRLALAIGLVLLAGCSARGPGYRTYSKEELEGIVLGKTMDEAVALLGPPDNPKGPHGKYGECGYLVYVHVVRTPDGLRSACLDHLWSPGPQGPNGEGTIGRVHVWDDQAVENLTPLRFPR